MKANRIINTIIESPYLGFWRVCGKDAQKKYRHLNKNGSDVDREALLREVIDVYIKGIEKMGIMPEQERQAKKARIVKMLGKLEAHNE